MHSTCSIDEQRMLLRAPEPGRVKVVLCTNIAESSLTVPDAAAIIDTCLCRDVTWDKTARSLTLRDNWISRESAMQRTGRCGRVQPGEVYRLVPRAFFEHALPAKCIPEIRRVPLEESILRTIRGPFKNVEEVLSRCIEPPDAEDVRAALQNLVDLGLVERRPDPDTLGKTIIAEPTPLGRITAELPVPWQMGMFLVLAKSFGLLDEAIVIAAAVATGSPFKRIPILPALEHEARVRFSGGFRCDLVARFNAYCYWAAEREKLNLGGFTGVSMAANTAGSSAENIAAAEFRWCEMNVLDLRQLREIDNLVFALRGKLSAFGLCPQPRKSEVAKRVFYRRELIQNEHLGIAAQDPLGDSAGRSRRGDGVSQLASYMAYAQEWQEQEFDEDEDEEKENEKEEERGCAKVSTRKDFDKVVFDRKKELMKTPGQTNVVLERIEFALRLPSSSFIETHSTEEIIEMKKQYITLTEDDYNNLQGIESYEAGLDSGCNGNVCEDEEKEKEEEEKSEKTTKKKETKKKQKSKKEKLKEEGNSNNNNNNEEEEEENSWKQLSLNVKDSQDKVLVLQTLLAAVYPQNVFKVSTKAVVKPVWDMWVNVPDRWDPCSVVELNGAKFWNSPTSFYFRNFTTNGLHATETFEDHDSTSREPPFFVHMDKDSVRPFAGKTAIESQKLIPESAFSEGVVRMLKIWNKNFDMTYLNGGGWNRHTEQSQNNNNNSNSTESPSSYASVAALKSAYAQQQRLEQERQQQQQQQQRYHLKSFQAFGQTFYTPLVNAGNKEVDVDAGTYQDDDGDGGDNSTNGSQTSYVRLYINPSMSAGAHFVYQSGSLPLYVSGASLAHPLSPPPLSEELLELVRLKAAPRRGCLFRAPRRIGVSPDIFYQQSERTGRIVCSAHSVSMFPDDALSITEVIPLVFLRNVSYKKGHLSATYLGCSISQYASIPREYLNSVEKLRRWIEVSFQELFRDAAYWPLKHSVGDDTSLKFTRDEARLYGTAYRSEKAARKALLKLIRSNVIVLSALNSEDYEAMKAYATAAATNTYKGKGSRTRLVAGTSAMELASSSISSSLSRNKAEYFTKLSLEPKDNDSDYDSDYVDDC